MNNLILLDRGILVPKRKIYLPHVKPRWRRKPLDAMSVAIVRSGSSVAVVRDVGGGGGGPPATEAQYMLPGVGYINMVASGQYMLPGYGYVNL